MRKELIQSFLVSDCNVSGNYTIISAPNDAKYINSCSALAGSLSLLFQNKPSAWDSDKAAVDLGDLGSIEGDFVIYPDSKSGKTVVTASDLKSVDGAFTISDNSITKAIGELDVSLPALGSVGKGFTVTGGFEKLAFELGDGLEVGEMMRVYSTKVEELEMDGLTQVDGDFSVDNNKNLEDLKMGSLAVAKKGFSVQTNPALTSVSFPKLKTVKGDVSFYQNSQLTTVLLPALESAQTISMTSNGKGSSYSFPRLSSLGNSTTTSTSTFSDCSKIQFASLSEVQGSVTFQSTNLEDLTIPLLKSMNGTLTVQNNPSLATFALPRVKSIADLTLKSNDKLTNFTANALKSAGTISLKGSFTNVEFFGLEEVTGDFKVVGSDSMDCSWFEANIKKIVKGSFTCVGDHDKKERKASTGGIEDTEGNPEDYITSDDKGASKPPTSSDAGKNKSEGSGDSSSGDNSKSEKEDDKSESKGTSTGTKIGMGVGIAVGVIILIVAGVMVFLFLRRNKSKKDTEEEVKQQQRNSQADIFDGQQMGVHTKIEANNNSAGNSAPSLGTLDFSRNSWMDSSNAGSFKEMNPFKTIRRVSGSTSGASDNVVKS